MNGLRGVGCGYSRFGSLNDFGVNLFPSFQFRDEAGGTATDITKATDWLPVRIKHDDCRITRNPVIGGESGIGQFLLASHKLMMRKINLNQHQVGMRKAHKRRVIKDFTL